MPINPDGIIKIDQELCTGCRRCSELCPADAIEGEQGQPQTINTTRCITCGQCVQVCSGYASIFDDNITPRAVKIKERGLSPSLREPLFAAYEENYMAEIKEALQNPEKVVLAQCDLNVCNALAEDFGYTPGSIAAGQVVAALKRIGVDKVFPANLPASLAIIEESYEFMERLDCGRNLPVINSSCAATVKYIEQFYPELIYYLSTCKSPSQISGALFKSYGAVRLGINPAAIYSVSIVPCTSKKFEAQRSEMKASGYDGYRDIDAVLTTRELAYLIKDAGIDITKLEEVPFNRELGDVPGLENVYCTTGDIVKAVFTTSRELLNDDSGNEVAFEFPDNDTKVIKYFTATIAGRAVKGIAISGLKNAVPFFEAIRAGKTEFGFMEVMSCPLGCVSGGGQPKVLLPGNKMDVYRKRAALVAGYDVEHHGLTQQPDIIKIYQDFFQKPYGDKSNRVLHTQYIERHINE